MAFADARAKLRKEFRQRLSVGAWNDMFTHIFKRVRFINPTPAAEAKLLGEKMARNAEFREVRAQAIKRRLDEGEALGSRAAAGRGMAAGEGSQDNVEDGRVAGSFILAGLVGTGAGGGSAGGAQGSGVRAGTGRQGEQLSNDLSLKGGRLRANNYNFAPSHSTKLHSDKGTGDSGGTHSSGDSQSGGDDVGGSDSSRGEGRSSSGGNCGTGSSGSSRTAGNKAKKKKNKVQAGVGETESRLESRVGGVCGTKVGPGRSGSTSGG